MLCKVCVGVPIGWFTLKYDCDLFVTRNGPYNTMVMVTMVGGTELIDFRVAEKKLTFPSIPEPYNQ